MYSLYVHEGIALGITCMQESQINFWDDFIADISFNFTATVNIN